jgi:hypothetical protein
VYNDFVKAVADFTDGTEGDPMRLLVAPWVYSIDDPAVDVISGMYGMTISKQWMQWEGLTYKPAYVVICSYRGENWGAGPVNFTNFQIIGNGFTLKNLTIGNYCAVDLEYGLDAILTEQGKPVFSRPKKTASNTHAQLISIVSSATSGDKAFAQRVRFVSRLNMFPMMGATRTMYDHCHFECTDDSMNSIGVYLSCDFDLYGKFPFGGLSGAALLDCVFRSHIGDEPNVKQYLSKNQGPGTVIDGRFFTDLPQVKLGWTRELNPNLRAYQYNVTLNGKKAVISDDVPGVTVELENYPELLKAYKFNSNGETVYNTYNLVRGNDDWDPMGVKDKALAASAGSIPIHMTASASASSIETGSVNNTSTTSYTVTPGRNPGAASSPGTITWEIYSGGTAATLTNAASPSALVTANNTTIANVPVIVEAVSDIGLRAAVIITSQPGQLAAPGFTTMPSISFDSATGKLRVNYALNLPAGLGDKSEITWYRCDDAAGTNPIPVAVTRLITEDQAPEYEYTLQSGDAGHYIMAGVKPRHNISPAGTEVMAAYATQIAASVVRTPNRFTTDFRTFPDGLQDQIIPGYWTADYIRYPDGSQPAGSVQAGTSTNLPSFTAQANSRWSHSTNNTANTAPIGGAAGKYGLISGQSFGARLMYTPVAGSYGNMSLTLVAAAEKLEGQGFASAGQGMDVLIKFDTNTKTGYGVRIQRVPAAGDAVAVNLIRYDNGNVTYLTNEGNHVSPNGAATNAKLTCAYQADSTIELKVTGTTLSVKVSSSTPPQQRHINAGYKAVSELSATISSNTYGGVHIYHFGGRGTDGRTLLRSLDVQWQ